MRAALERAGSLADWDAFAASWGDLETDTYMADKGRYRKRRYAVYSAEGNTLTREKHQPHFQTLDYNPLHGGIERWFEPILPEIGGGQSMATILHFCRTLFDKLTDDAVNSPPPAGGVRGGVQKDFIHPPPNLPRKGGGTSAALLDPQSPTPASRSWHIEIHQFRIEAKAGEKGQPTPEGMHRDGRDYVLVLLVRRANIKSGVTTIHNLDKKEVGSFTLTHPFDAALVDDARVFHGVTAVTPLDPKKPAYRDVLVVTFKAR